MTAVPPIPPYRFALVDPARHDPHGNVESITLADLQILVALSGPVSANLQNWLELRLHIPGLNSGVDVVSTLNGTSRWGSLGQSAFYSGPMWAPRAGSAAWLYVVADSRRCVLPQPGAGAYSTAYLRPYALSGLQLFASDFGLAYPATTGVVVAGAIPQGRALIVSGLFRKFAAGDNSSCRVCFGFADNTFLSPTALIARCGLLGDGAGGYRYGSVNCPDGQAIAVENAHTDIDANAVQPPDLVAPGTNWWTSEIKIVPAQPSGGGFWTARHNGTLVATFNTATNIPRGSGGTNNDFARIEGLWMANEGTQGRMPLDALIGCRLTDDLSP